MGDKYKEQIRLFRLLAVIFTATALVIIVALGVYHFRINLSNNNSGNTSLTSYQEYNNLNNDPQTLGDITIQQSKVMYVAGTTLLTSKIINNGIEKDNLSFKIKIISKDNNTLAEAVGFVGKINKGETKYVESYITVNILDVNQIVYEKM